MNCRVEGAVRSDDAGGGDAEPKTAFQAQFQMGHETLAIVSVNLYVKNGTPVFDIKVDTHDGQGFVPHLELGLEGGLGFGVTPASIVGSNSPFHTTIHELIELGVPLDIPAGFSTPGRPFPSGGQSGATFGEPYAVSIFQS